MRTYGRTTDLYGNKTWVVVQTDINGFNDAVYLTTFIQCCYLNLEESPFYGDYGLPAVESIATQIFPDYNMAYMTKKFQPFFTSLVTVRVANYPAATYNVSIITTRGVKLTGSVPK